VPSIDPDAVYGSFFEDANLDQHIQDPTELYQRVAGRFVCSHAVASAVLRDPRTGSEPATRPSRPLWDLVQRWLITRDPPDHTAIRSLVSRAFTRPAVRIYETQIRGIVSRLLDEIAPRKAMDLVAEFATPLPSEVIEGVMGLDDVERDGLRQLLRTLETCFVNQHDRELVDDGERAMIELYERFERMIDKRLSTPGDDLLSRYAVGGREAGVDHVDLVSNAVFLAFAGQDSTRNALGSLVFELLRHPDQLALLRAEPERYAASAVEEALRYHPPIYGAPRWPRDEIDVGEGTLPPRKMIDFLFGPANRDAAVFSEPDRFDITRSPNPHLSFAVGPHHCAGAPLARLELQIAITSMLQGLPGLRLISEPRWKSLVPFRGLAELRIAWD